MLPLLAVAMQSMEEGQPVSTANEANTSCSDTKHDGGESSSSQTCPSAASLDEGRRKQNDLRLLPAVNEEEDGWKGPSYVTSSSCWSVVGGGWGTVMFTCCGCTV